MATNIHECCKISVPLVADIESGFSFPLLFFDMMWYRYHAIQSVCFFDFPCSRSHFLGNIVPNLKTSLSLTLTHFLPLAGKIIHPLKNPAGQKPILHYEAGDSVDLIISESAADFNHLTGNSPRVADEFYAFIPNMLPETHSEISIACDVMAVQVTLFPGKGLSIGCVCHHAAVDGNTLLAFNWTWALINQSRLHGADYNSICAENNFSRYYDRETLRNLNELLETRYWDAVLGFSSLQVQPPWLNFPIKKLRSTFVIKNEEIQRLKNFVLAKCAPDEDVPHLSSFNVVCALVWFCSANSAEATDDEPEYFNFVADCRARLSPPLPANYFGNCLAALSAELKHGELKGKDGLVKAAKAIGEAIEEMNEKGFLFIAEKWPELYKKMPRKRECGVWGSAKFDIYAMDYGWGKPKKCEILSIDGTSAEFSLYKSKEVEGGMEIGVSYPKSQMEAFSNVFNEVLRNFSVVNNLSKM